VPTGWCYLGRSCRREWAARRTARALKKRECADYRDRNEIPDWKCTEDFHGLSRRIYPCQGIFARSRFASLRSMSPSNLENPAREFDFALPRSLREERTSHDGSGGIRGVSERASRMLAGAW